MKIFGSLLLILSTFYSSAQTDEWFDYQPLKSKGSVPSDFTKDFFEKLEKHDAKANELESRIERIRASDFYIKSTYDIRELLKSGSVFYGDTVTLYCRTILNKLLNDFPDLQKEIRLYLVKDPEHNAYTTDDGIIFVNTGLLAQLETEAQLAFVLAHEIVHYAENHILDQYLEFEKIKSDYSKYGGVSNLTKMNSMSHFSKNSELEADRLGYTKYFKNSGYNISAPNQLMDIMLYSYLPFNEIPLSQDFLNIASLRIPPDFYREEVTNISAIENYNDSLSSHPNIKKRRSTMLYLIKADSGGEDFIISKDWFLHCRKICRFENTRVFVTNRQYEKAIYNSYLLLLKNPQSKFLKKSIAKSLYAYSAYANKSELGEIKTYWADVEGESQQVYFMLNSMSNAELNVTALVWILSLRKEFPNDLYLEMAYKRCLDNLVYDNRYTFENFSSETYESALSRIADQKKNEDTVSISRGNSKVANIKMKKQSSENYITEDFTKYALSDFVNDSSLKADFETRNTTQAENKRISTINARRKPVAKKDIYDKNIALGIDKVIFTNLQYLNITDNDGFLKPQLEKSVKNQKKYQAKIEDLSEKLKLETVFLEHESINTKDAVEFNHYAAINSWLKERMNHQNTGVLVSEIDYIDAAKVFYQTDKVVLSGNRTFKDKNLNTMRLYGTVMYSIFVYPMMPYLYAKAFTPDYYSYNYYYVFDLNNGNVILAETTSQKNSDASDVINSTIYNNLLQTKEKPQPNYE